MTQSEKITELKGLLAEAKEALMNRDPHTRARECYDSGHVPCRCTLCRINEALKPQPNFADVNCNHSCTCCEELAELREELDDMDSENKFHDR